MKQIGSYQQEYEDTNHRLTTQTNKNIFHSIVKNNTFKENL